jgi:hypothetical protein
MLSKKQGAAMGRAGYGVGRRDYYSDGRGGGMDGDFLEAEEEDADDGRAAAAGAKVAAGWAVTATSHVSNFWSFSKQPLYQYCHPTKSTLYQCGHVTE